MSNYPEHDKLIKVVTDTHAAGDFIGWLEERYGAHIMHWVDNERGKVDPDNPLGSWWEPVPGTLRDWLAEWKGIDQNALEREKRAMLDALRARQMGGA